MLCLSKILLPKRSSIGVRTLLISLRKQVIDFTILSCRHFIVFHLRGDSHCNQRYSNWRWLSAFMIVFSFSVILVVGRLLCYAILRLSMHRHSSPIRKKQDQNWAKRAFPFSFVLPITLKSLSGKGKHSATFLPRTMRFVNVQHRDWLIFSRW